MSTALGFAVRRTQPQTSGMFETKVDIWLLCVAFIFLTWNRWCQLESSSHPLVSWLPVVVSTYLWFLRTIFMIRRATSTSTYLRTRRPQIEKRRKSRRRHLFFWVNLGRMHPRGCRHAFLLYSIFGLERWLTQPGFVSTWLPGWLSGWLEQEAAKRWGRAKTNPKKRLSTSTMRQ